MIDDNGTVAFIATTYDEGNVVFTQSQVIAHGYMTIDGVTDFSPNAVAMNDIGQIAILATYRQGGGSVILLATPVPEPSTLLLLLAGAAMCIVARRRC